MVMKILILWKTCVLCCDKKDCHETMHFKQNGSYRNIIESGLIVKFSITIRSGVEDLNKTVFVQLTTVRTNLHMIKNMKYQQASKNVCLVF